jgi:dephospho-CoA kinase
LALGDHKDLVKLLNSLLDTDFPFEQIDVDTYIHLITMGYTQLVQKIILRFSLTNTMPNKKLVKELLKSYLDKGNTEYWF